MFSGVPPRHDWDWLNTQRSSFSLHWWGIGGTVVPRDNLQAFLQDSSEGNKVTRIKKAPLSTKNNYGNLQRYKVWCQPKGLMKPTIIKHEPNTNWKKKFGMWVEFNGKTNKTTRQKERFKVWLTQSTRYFVVQGIWQKILISARHGQKLIETTKKRR